MATTVKVGDSIKFHLNHQDCAGFITFGEPGSDGPHDGVVVGVAGSGDRVDVEAVDSKGNKHLIANLPVSPAKAGQSFVSGCEVTEAEKPLGNTAAVDDIVSNEASPDSIAAPEAEAVEVETFLPEAGDAPSTTSAD